LGPTATVAGRERKPDFRIRVGNEPWTYVEITRPDTSDAKEQLEAICETLSGVLDVVKGEYALEVFLRREPTETEANELQQQINESCRLQGVQVVELASGLGTLYLNHTQPGMVTLDDHGEPYVPRLAQPMRLWKLVRLSVTLRCEWHFPMTARTSFYVRRPSSYRRTPPGS
jgi:hypothetical protein